MFDSAYRCVGWIALCLAVLSGLGCESKADKFTLDAVAALDTCDVRTAHNDFVTAHAADPHHPQAALGFALTDLAMLPEAPEATDLLSNLGFTAPVNMQVLMFGSGGVLTQLSKGDSCTSINTFVNNTIPYPPLSNSNIDGWSVLKPGLTGESFRADVTAVMGHLSQEAQALETAAKALSGTQTYSMKGTGCGQGTPIVLQRADLYAAAAVLEAASGLLQIVLSYDWGFSIAVMQSNSNAQRTQLAQELNAHLGRLNDASGVAAARSTLQHALDLATSALDAATAARTPVTNELFDWPSLPVERIADLRRMVVSAQASLTTPTALADITPALISSVATLFDSPPDASHLSSPLFTTQTDTSGNVSVSLDQNRVSDAIGGATSPNLFGNSVPTFQWAPNAAWNQLPSDPIVAPIKSIQQTYSCR